MVFVNVCFDVMLDTNNINQFMYVVYNLVKIANRKL